MDKETQEIFEDFLEHLDGKPIVRTLEEFRWYYAGADSCSRRDADRGYLVISAEQANKLKAHLSLLIKMESD